MSMDMGSSSVYTSTKGIKFQDGTIQTTAAGGSGGAVNTVQVLVDFGSDSGRIARVFDASTAVSAPWVTSGSTIVVSLAGRATATHGIEDGLIEGLLVQAENIVAGVGFTLHAYSPRGSWGKYAFNCAGI